MFTKDIYIYSMLNILKGVIQWVILYVNAWFYFMVTSDWANVTYNMIIDTAITYNKLYEINYNHGVKQVL